MQPGEKKTNVNNNTENEVDVIVESMTDDQKKMLDALGIDLATFTSDNEFLL